MLSAQISREVVRAAKANNIDPASLLAVVEIESAGRALEDDGVTPRLLFERHVFYRELSKRASGRLPTAVAQGLAHRDWRRSTQYKDQGSSAKRLALLSRARAIDTECANRSCSWGLGQTMGFLAEELGFVNANAMLAHMTGGGVAAQIDLMIREIKRKKVRGKSILTALNERDWATFAEGYNGKGYRANRYDTKLANAYASWRDRVPSDIPETVVSRPVASNVIAFGEVSDRVKRLQTALLQRGFSVGPDGVDGEFGPATRAAVIAFQSARRLPPTGEGDGATQQALGLVPGSGPIAAGSGVLTPESLLRLIISGLVAAKGQAGQKPAGGAETAQLFQAVIAALLGRTGAIPSGTTPTALPPSITLSFIDKLFGGEALAGKKTLIAVIAYVILAILQATGQVGTATGSPAPTVSAAAAPAAGTTTAAPGGPAAVAPASSSVAPAAQAPATPSPDAPATASAVTATPAQAKSASAVTATPGTRTPTGEILTTLILAFGGLGLLAKIDRLVRTVAVIGSKVA